MEQTYKLEIIFGNTGSKELKPQTFTISGLKPADGNFKSWLRDLRANLYTTGFNLPMEDGRTELISPLHIHTAYLSKEDQ